MNKNIIFPFIFNFLCVVIIEFILLILLTDQSSAATITVDDDGPAAYSNIQYAIDNATEGDTIIVKEVKNESLS